MELKLAIIRKYMNQFISRTQKSQILKYSRSPLRHHKVTEIGMLFLFISLGKGDVSLFG